MHNFCLARRSTPFRALSFSVLSLVSALPLCTAAPSQANTPTRKPVTTFRPTALLPLKTIPVQVGAFTGGDSELAQAVSETLLTDLAKSDRITILDSRQASVRGALSPVYVLTGSCLSVDDNLVLNVRLVEAATGKTLPGAAENMDGPRSEVFTMVHTLASHLNTRLTALRVVSTPVARVSASPNTVRLASTANVRLPRLSLPSGGSTLETGGRGTSDNETALGGVAGDGAERQARLSSGRTKEPLDSYRDEDCDTGNERNTHYTGLIIDMRGLGAERSMSPRLRRADGSSIWTGGEAAPDFVIEEGIVVYAATMRDARKLERAGSHPLVIEATRLHDTPFPSDPILDDEDADYLLKAARRDGFLKKFRVVFVTGR